MKIKIHHLSLSLSLFLAGAWPAVSAQTPVLAPALQPFVDDHSLPGAVVLVADKDKILDLEAVGYADVAAQKPMQPDSMFWIASMTKSITCTLLMMLVDEGKVNVDDPVEKYLPEFKDQQVALTPEPAATIKPPGAIQGYVIHDETLDQHAKLVPATHVMTIRNLMTHTSGMSPIKLPRQLKDKDLVPLSELVAGYAKQPLKFDPGTRYEYSNHGMETVGRIIEVASGMKYQDFLQQRLLTPLGMKDTTFWPTDEQFARLPLPCLASDAQKHIITQLKRNGYFTYPLSNPLRQPFPAGGLYSTATDLSIFCRMLLNGGVYQGHRYLSLQSLQQMTSTQTGDLCNKGLNDTGYGFGWQTVHKLHPTDAGIAGPFGHGGAYGTEMWIDPTHSLIRIFMVQYEGGLPPGETGKKIKSAFNQAVHDNFEKPQAAGNSP